jgi:hypothetical protein
LLLLVHGVAAVHQTLHRPDELPDRPGHHLQPTKQRGGGRWLVVIMLQLERSCSRQQCFGNV